MTKNGKGKIKVLEIIQTAGPALGGAETIVLNLIRHLDKSRFEPRALVVGHGMLVDTLRADGYGVDTFKFTKSYNRELITLIRRLIYEHNIDIVHTHLSRMNMYGFVASRFSPAANVMTVHGLTECTGSLARLYYFLLGNLSGRVITVSHTLADEFNSLTRVRRSKIKAIPNGIDISRFDRKPNREETRKRFGLPAEAKVILTVGNARLIKGYDFLIEAFSRIAAEDERMYLVFGGGDMTYYPREKHLDPLVARHGLEDRIVFTGFVPDVEALYGAADLFVLSSITEGFSLTTVEAMASSLPVLSTDCVGPREIITEGTDGIIIPERDPEVFGRAMLELLRDDPRRQALGRAARLKVEERYTLDKSLAGFERLFETLIKRK
ncbi:MAG: glycosyltransferase family 4 protein [FCB group bacterium]|nr:glycosyltransferase family 4 protein [FCB group bacterium]